MAHTGANKDGSHPHAPQSVNSWQPDYVEALFAQFKADPDSVGPEWKNFFLGFELGLKLEGAEGVEAAAAPRTTPKAPEVAAEAAATDSSRAPQAAAAAAAAPTTGATSGAFDVVRGAAAASTPSAPSSFNPSSKPRKKVFHSGPTESGSILNRANWAST